MYKKAGLFLLLLRLFAPTLSAQIPVTGYNHVALSVKNIEESARFYREVIGLEPIEVPEHLKAIRSWFRIAPGQELHLLAGRTFPVANNDPNMAHFSLTILDADPVEAYLKTKGLPYLRQQRFDGAWQIYIADPDGYFIELNEPKVPWKYLFSGKDLSGWDTYIGPPFGPDGKPVPGAQPAGLNKDEKQVFSIVTEDGQKALRISGEQFGGISTTESYENYHLQLQFKWGKLKWAPKTNDKRDSGVLYHANGPHGADYGFWMQSQEFQVQEGDCGDYWGVAGAAFDVPAKKQGEKDWVFDAKSTVQSFAEKSAAGRHCIKSPDAEKPSGEWNTLDIYVLGDTAVHMVNGKVVMVLYHSRRPTAKGGFEPLTKGKIQLQSEGAEVFYRNIRMLPISEIPAGILTR
jgi:catechol 2,3-dioxygenase-like lactoylglutathione lyase family enzyme